MIPIHHLYKKEQSTYVTQDYFRFLLSNDLVIDASEGGLVQGASMAEGGISLIGCNQKAEIFVAGKVEGWMFLINAFASFENREILLRMSCYSPSDDISFKPYSVASSINILNVEKRELNGEIVSPVLYFSTNNMSVMPKAPSKTYLQFLDSINRQAWQKNYAEMQKGTLRDTALLARSGVNNMN